MRGKYLFDGALQPISASEDYFSGLAKATTMDLPPSIMSLLRQLHANEPQQKPLLRRLHHEISRHLTEQQQQLSWEKALQGNPKDQAPAREKKKTRTTQIESLQTKQLAYQDRVTGLPNQALGRRFLSQQLSRARAGEGCVALVFLDVLGLRELNFHLGRELTDKFLRKLGQRLSALALPEDALVRGLEDEFWLILFHKDPAGLKKLVSVVRKRLVHLLESLETPIDLGPQCVMALLSCGVACSDGEAATELLLERAQTALEAGKSGDRISFWSPQLDKARDQRRKLAPELSQALQEDRFTLCYQAIFKLQTLQIQGVEGFLRWNHPDRGLLSPDAFLQAACQSGQIVAIGDWVMGRVCALSQRFPEHYVCWNLSAQELLQGDFAKRLSRALSCHKARPDRVVLEISEVHLALDNPRFIKIIQEIRRWNVHIAVDDFSFGSFSLGRLEKIQARFLKLGPEVARHIDHPLYQGLTKGAVLAAESLGCRVIAEGIETESSLHKLKELGCHWGQGMWLGKPVSDTDLTNLLTPAANS